MGAAWCVHCGRDLTQHRPIEVSRSVEPEKAYGLTAALDALLLGLAGGAAFVVVDVLTWLADWRVGLGFWVATLISILFVLSEFAIPAGRPRDLPHQDPLPVWHPISRRRRKDTWVPPSPYSMLLGSLPLLSAIALVAFLEPQFRL